MTLFEYLSVAISIVLSLSAAQVLGNLREVFDPSRRYWVHAPWVVQTLWLAPPPSSALILVACIAGFVSSNRWLHAILVVVTSVGRVGVAYDRLKVGV